MIIEVCREGGFGGITRTWRVRVEDTDDPDSWRLLINSCPWDSPDAVVGGADRYVYRVRADDREVTLGEPALQGPWQALVERVRQFSGGHGIGPEAPVDLDKHPEPG